MASALVTPEELQGLLHGSQNVQLLDVRWSLAAPDGREEYRRGHLPGAVYVDLDNDLAAPRRPATAGRHPLPDIDTLQVTARRLGIRNGDIVVAYDAWNNMGAARAWWLLGWAGIADVRVLNGGLAAWEATGRELEPGEITPVEGDVELSPGHRRTLTMDEAASLASNGTLIDSRAPERFRGETEPMDPRAGHIPGAVNIPAAAYLRDGRFVEKSELEATFEAKSVLSDTEVGTSCGSGITAAHTALALNEIGVTVAVYPGSWSQWSNHADRPAATGKD